MPRPTPEEIEEFNRRMNEPEDNGDDFEIEIFTPEGHGARLPYSRGREYLQQHFGIDVGEPPNASNSADGGTGDGTDPLNASRPSTSSRYFGKTRGGTQTQNPANPPQSGTVPNTGR